MADQLDTASKEVFLKFLRVQLEFAERNGLPQLATFQGLISAVEEGGDRGRISTIWRDRKIAGKELPAQAIREYAERLSSLNQQLGDKLDPEIAKRGWTIDPTLAVRGLLLWNCHIADANLHLTSVRIPFALFQNCTFSHGLIVSDCEFSLGVLFIGLNAQRLHLLRTPCALLRFEWAHQLPEFQLHSCRIGRVEFAPGNEQTSFFGSVLLSDCDFGTVQLEWQCVKKSFLVAGSRFSDTCSLRASKFLGRTVLSGDFRRCPELFEAKLSSETILSGMNLGGAPVGSGRISRLQRDERPAELLALRHLRTEAQAKRWTRDEVRFFAEEQRIERAMTFWGGRWFEKTLSWLYDMSSAYGTSVGRAFVAFLLWNSSFAFLFAGLFAIWPYQVGFGTYAFGISSCEVEVRTGGGLEEWPSVALSLQNAVNPLALFTEKSMVSVHNASAVFLSLLQAVGSLAMVALFLLALRGRFQRSGAGSGGGS